MYDKSMPDVTIRKATRHDLVSLQELGTELMLSDRRFDPSLIGRWYLDEAGKKYLLSRIKGRKHVCFIAEVQNRIVGYVTGTMCGNETWRSVSRTELENLFVLHKYRRHGIGNELLETFKSWSSGKGAQKIKVYVTAFNKEALPFYTKNGFQTLNILMEVDMKPRSQRLQKHL